MAQVLLGFGDPSEALRVQSVLEVDGHTVTVAQDF